MISCATYCRIAGAICTFFQMFACLVLSYTTLCRFAGVVCTFSPIGCVDGLSSLPLLAMRNTFWTVRGVGTIVAWLIKPVFEIKFLSIATVIGSVLTVLNGKCFRDINFVYELSANSSVAEIVIGGRSMYKYCPDCNGDVAMANLLIVVGFVTHSCGSKSPVGILSHFFCHAVFLLVTHVDM